MNNGARYLALAIQYCKETCEKHNIGMRMLFYCMLFAFALSPDIASAACPAAWETILPNLPVFGTKKTGRPVSCSMVGNTQTCNYANGGSAITVFHTNTPTEIYATWTYTNAPQYEDLGNGNLGQLVNTISGSVDVRYAMDGNGHVLSSHWVSSPYTLNYRNGYTLIASDDSVYDPSGNRISGTLTTNGVTDTYDVWDACKAAYATGYSLYLDIQGQGVVTSDIAGINCNSTCGRNFPGGTLMILTAKASPGSAFAGWGGACTGTGNCTVEVTAAKSVTAAFRSVPFATTTTGVNATGVVTDTIATVTNTISFNAGDVGKNGAVFVTAWVPTSALSALGIPVAGSREKSGRANAEKVRRSVASGDSSGGFTLIQLSSSGWQQVSAGQLLPYASGVLGAQTSAQTILSNTDTSALKGAQFCVGYGTSADEMSSAWRMQTIATVAGSTASGSCIVAKQVSGWWWNEKEGGRGYFVEMKNGRYFAASYLYDNSGNPLWYVTGPGDAFANNVSGNLAYYSGGQTLTGAWKSPTGPIGVGNYSISFSDATHGTITWPGGSVAITRYLFGDTSASPAFQPETGWWWNADEGGRGFSVEVQGNQIFVAGFMYDGSGNPVWYVSGGQMTTPSLYVGTWMQYGGGQTMAGAWKAANVTNPNVGTAAFSFDSATTGTLQLPNGRQVRLVRFTF